MASILNSSNSLAQLSALDGPQLLALATRHAPQIVAGLAVIGIAWEAARLTWLLVAPGVASAVATPPMNRPPVAASNAVDAQGIADAHLFGLPGSGAADPNSLPATQMSLVLAGTMALDDPEAGFAIVGENAASAKFYRVGAMINGGVRLHSVYPDRVIIDRNGALETLVLPRGIPSNAPLPVARNVTLSNPIENLRRIATANPSALGELLRAQPVFSNGTQKGYRIYPGRDRQQFARLGLQPGDLVTAVNGSSLEDPSRGNDILNTLVASSTAQVTVERNGTIQQLSLDMAQISLPDSNADNSSASSAVSTTSSFNGPPRTQQRNTGGVPAGLPSGPGAE